MKYNALNSSRDDIRHPYTKYTTIMSCTCAVQKRPVSENVHVQQWCACAPQIRHSGFLSESKSSLQMYFNRQCMQRGFVITNPNLIFKMIYSTCLLNSHVFFKWENTLLINIWIMNGRINTDAKYDPSLKMIRYYKPKYFQITFKDFLEVMAVISISLLFIIEFEYIKLIYILSFKFTFISK